MHLLDACAKGDVLKSIYVIFVIIKVIKILVPIILILFSIKELFSVVISNDNSKLKDAINTLIIRFFIGAMIFFIPTLILSVINLVITSPNNFKSCINNATPQGIENAYYNEVLDKINEAKQDLDGAKLKSASTFASSKIKSNDKLNNINKKIEKVQGFIDIANEISKMTSSNQYNDLRNKINNITDRDVKASLLEKLEKKYHNILEEEAIIKEVSNSSLAEININGDIVKQEETETLKVIIKKVSTYYITQIWVKDPYNQLNKYDSPKYGKSLYKPSTLLKNAINEKGLANKLIVGFNASGFYLKDTYDAASVNKYSAYDKTSVGTLVITDGKVVRSAYKKAYKTWYIAGVNKNGILNIYTDAKTSNADTKKSWSETVISEIRNTFTFASPLVTNGLASKETTSMPSAKSKVKRQAICQIDKNNFMLITGNDLSRQNLIDIMLKAKCQTGTNFDGGGSIALLFKSKNSTSINKIIGDNRALTEVGYFSE